MPRSPTLHADRLETEAFDVRRAAGRDQKLIAGSTQFSRGIANGQLHAAPGARDAHRLRTEVEANALRLEDPAHERGDVRVLARQKRRPQRR